MSGFQGRGILSGDHSKANFGYLLGNKRLPACTRMSWGVKSFLIKKVLNGAPDFHKKKIASNPKGKGHLQSFEEIQGS